MYSVIIQTQKTMETFSTYRSLFADAIHNDKVGFCTWNKNGKTIDQALPDLRELTDDKKEWTAVIICNDVGNRRKTSEGVRNPFDYVGDQPEDELSESENPVIRLTHMLGGLPAIEKRFKGRIIEEPFKEPRLVYEPIEEDERFEAYDKLKKQYQYDGVLPRSVILISIRLPWDEEEDISRSWRDHVESDSSEFWKRNRYPAVCRFLVFDFVRQGPVRREADMFRFWITVMLLATNKIDSSTLQAYRLYRVNTLLDKEIMEDTFQRAVNRISSARSVIKSDIRKESRGFVSSEPKLPDYSIEIPVFFDLPKTAKCTVKPSTFRMISQSPMADIGMWDTAKKNAEDALVKSVRIADRALDQTANRMKDNYLYDEQEVVRLDKYQREDLELETDELYKNIIDIQGRLPTSKISTDEETEAKAVKVREYLRGRVTPKPVLLTYVAGIVLVLLAQIPAVVQYFIGEQISWTFVGLEVLTFTLVILLSGGITLLFQKKKLDSLVGSFNRKMQATFGRIQLNAGEYSDYLSAIASHSRGRSYLDIAASKSRSAASAGSMRYKHLAAIDLFLERLKTWGGAYHLDVDYEKPEINDEIIPDVMIPPADSMLYSLETGSMYDIEVNRSGMKINTPFAFISKLELIREELYDDDN